tara:strand:+ start:9649 stop:10653 length:1005 start_codon:yes stop_codon:yes gene_type:complete
MADKFSDIKAKIALAEKKAVDRNKAYGKQKKANFDRGELEESQATALKRISSRDATTSISGVGGDTLIEAKPTYVKAKGERVFATPNNAYLILGRDRPGNKKSGYSGKGHTQCGSVDIVVGRKIEGKRRLVDPDFDTDSARIHICQKTDVDKNFDLKSGPGTPKSEARGSIALKSDTIRIVARENIRLVTMGEGKNSQGGQVVSTGGIDLMAGNTNSGDDKLQPLVKGDNMREAIEEFVKLVDSLSGIVSGFLQEQIIFNIAANTHFHHSPFFGMPTTPSPGLMPVGNNVVMNLFSKTKLDLVQYKINLVDYKFKYLSSVNPSTYINSKYNSTN